MTSWALIPVKELAAGKSRLADALDPEAREALVLAMAGHVVEAAAAASNIARICLVGPSRLGLSSELTLLADPGEGLNAALQSAFAELAGQPVGRVVVIAADLPQVTATDIQLLAVAPGDEIAIAPDRHGTGTNALSLPLPAARDFRFAFGKDSFARHHDEAERLGLKIETIHSLGLERDIDEPPDLPDAMALLKTPG